MTKRRGARRAWAFVSVVALLISGTATLAWANHEGDPAGPAIGATGSDFEILDGNTVRNGSAGDHYDWDDPPGAVTVQAEEETGNDDNSFTQGTKENTAVPVVEFGSIPPNKSDLKEFGFTVENNTAGDFLHLFWTRVQDPSGTTNMDFEFNSKSCVEGEDETGCSDNGVTPIRTTGDLLITYDLSRGGTEADISLRTWLGTEWSDAEDLDASVATGSINQSAITTDINGVPGSYSARTFGEATVNLDAIIDSDSCVHFGGAYLKSRSSDSFTAALKDFIAPVGTNITNCGSIKVKKVGDVGSNPLEGSRISLAKAGGTTISSAAWTATVPAATGTFTVADGSVLPTGAFKVVIDREVVDVSRVALSNTVTVVARGADGSTAAAHLSGATVLVWVASCAPVFNSSTPPTEASCTFTNLVFANYVLIETVVPAGYTPAANQSVSVTGTTEIVVTFINNRAPKNLTVQKRDDSSTAGAPIQVCIGADVTGCAGFKLYTAGQATTLSAAVTDKTALTMSVASASGMPSTPFYAIVDTEIVQVTGIASTTMTVVRGQLNTTAATHASGVAFTAIADSLLACVLTGTDTADDGNCTFQGILAPASFWIVETIVPAGYAPAPPTFVSFSLTDSDKTVKLVDPRLFKVIVLVCRQSDNSLYKSSVTYNGTTKDSLANNGASDPLCSTGGAAFSNQQWGGPVAGSVTIPQTQP